MSEFRIASLFSGNIDRLSGTPIRVKNLQIALRNLPDTSHLFVSNYVRTKNPIVAYLRNFWLIDLIHLVRKLRKFDPDLVVLHTLGGTSKFYFCLRILKLKYLLELHGIPSLERDLFKQSIKNRIKNPLLNWIEKETIRNASVVTTCSDSMTEFIMSINPKAITLLGGSSTSSKIFRESHLNDAITILYSGNTRPWQGLGFLETAAQRLSTSQYSIKFILVLSETKNIPSWFLENPLVEIHFNLSSEQLISIMSAANILVLPRNLDKVTKISFPSKIFDYMSSGKAIVAADLGDVSTVLQHEKNALLYPPGNLEVFLSAIYKLADHSYRAALGKAAREESAKYDWTLVGERFAAIVIRYCMR